MNFGLEIRPEEEKNLSPLPLQTGIPGLKHYVIVPEIFMGCQYQVSKKDAVILGSNDTLAGNFYGLTTMRMLQELIMNVCPRIWTILIHQPYLYK